MIASTLAWNDARAGQPIAEPILLEVQAPSGCTNTSVFWEQVHARTGAATLAAPGDTARRFDVEVREEKGAFVGLVTVNRDVESARRIQGTSCEEVTQALALIVALSIDPRAITAPKPPPPKPPEPPGSAWIPPRAPPGDPWPPLAQPLPAVPEPRRSWQVVVGGQGGVTSGPAPGVVGAAGAFFELRQIAPELVQFTGRLSFGAVPPTSVDLDLGSAEFSAYLARVEGCPIRFAPFETVNFVPCLHVDVGALLARGYAAATVERDRPWAAGGFLVRAEWIFWSPLSIEVQGGGAVPFVQDEFVFDPDRTVVHAVPPFMGSFLAGVGVRFP